MKVAQLAPAVFDPMDYTVNGFLQARILEWVAFSSPGDLPNPGIKPRSPALQVDSLPSEPQGKPKNEWGAFAFSSRSSNPGIEPRSPAFAGGFLSPARDKIVDSLSHEGSPSSPLSRCYFTPSLLLCLNFMKNLTTFYYSYFLQKHCAKCYHL